MMIVGREICKVFPVQINHGYKLFNAATAQSASLPRLM